MEQVSSAKDAEDAKKREMSTWENAEEVSNVSFGRKVTSEESGHRRDREANGAAGRAAIQ